ncbi:MAG: AzlD domain-containing protein [Clostridiales Family XIII bacterium]|jgi:branched-subunit amino acid transport protein|nr:AzlD domain-containing protein [Clostridiales Family XIII bacterium]
MNGRLLLYIAVMAGVTYLVRALPLTLFRKEITNGFVRSFLHYVPYVTLAVMVFPGILYVTDSLWSALAGFTAALALAWLRQSLITVALVACAVVFLVELIPGL